MKKVIFIDRDGTLIYEPPITKQVNSLAEMTILPFVISSLKKLYDAQYELIMVTNQDGLETKANPIENYELINKKLIEIFANEGINFSAIFACPHYERDNCNCRKPKTGLVKKYLEQNNIDKQNSFVIGDRITDIQFSENIEFNGLMLSDAISWEDITGVSLAFVTH